MRFIVNFCFLWVLFYRNFNIRALRRERDGVQMKMFCLNEWEGVGAGVKGMKKERRCVLPFIFGGHIYPIHTHVDDDNIPEVRFFFVNYIFLNAKGNK